MTDPETQLKVDVKYDVERAFCVEHGLLDDDETYTRNDIQDIVEKLSTPLHNDLKQRLKEQLTTLDDIMHAPNATFDQPRVTMADLPTACQPSQEMVH